MMVGKGMGEGSQGARFEEGGECEEGSVLDCGVWK